MATNKIKVAIAGIGFGKKVHMPALENCEELELTGLYHPTKKISELNITDPKIKMFNNWDDLITSSEIQALIIATPPSIRFKLAQEAIAKGKHLLLEKPVCLEASQIKTLQKQAILTGVSVGVDFEYRAVPIFKQAKMVIDNGLLGKIWMAKLDWIMNSRADETREWNWYSQEQEGGGVLGSLGTHAFDILHWLIGKTSKASGILSTSIKKRRDRNSNNDKEVTSDDVCFANLELLNKANDSKIPTQISLSSISRNGSGFSLEIYGSEGSLSLGSDNQKDYVHGFGLWVSQKNNGLKKIEPNDEFLFKRTWSDGRIAPVAAIQKEWAESIRNKSPMIPGLTEAYISQSVCDAIKESSLTGISQTIKF
tara:strand:- start:6793 stop:7893 length:1101 start_codon:yes stop_codon:yes gene_type:complete